MKIAVNSGISFGSRLTGKQLMVLAKYLQEGESVELTTFQQLYLEVEEEQLEDIKEEFVEVGLVCYPVGKYIKSLRTCNFCKGSEAEGMPVAKNLNTLLAGKEVPFTLRPAYTGCPVGCGEPLMNDIGVMKIKDTYCIYVGGNSKGANAQVGQLLAEKLSAEQLYLVVEKVVQLYQEHGKKNEKFHKFVDRYGFEELVSAIDETSFIE